MIGTTEVHSWFIPTTLQKDEALSSWLIRAALDSGCDPLSLTGALWPKWRIWSVDVDRGLSSEHLRALVNTTKIDESQFDSATLQNFLIKNELDSGFLDSWFLGLGTRNRKHRGGWQYCSQCLSKDVVAYFRLHWRFAWHTGCIKHGQRLHDQCPYCLSAIQPRRLQAPDRVMDCCSICKRSLSKIVGSSNDPHASAFQESFDHFLQQGYANYQGNLISLEDWLNITKLFIQLIRKILVGPLTGKGWMFLERLKIYMPHMEFISNGLAVDLLPVIERERLFSCVHQLLIIPQNQFIETALSLKMTRSSFWDKRSQLPAALKPIEDQLEIVSRHYPKNRALVEAFKPRSKQAVTRKFLRLKRKL
ncbi:TniQ family protein [Acinetobacter pecorum]|uniref:TniQ family protein n=1 Tax=Acinetobacter pecorum TaxID=2762215 RepID=UPI003EE58CDD